MRRVRLLQPYQGHPTGAVLELPGEEALRLHRLDIVAVLPEHATLAPEAIKGNEDTAVEAAEAPPAAPAVTEPTVAPPKAHGKHSSGSSRTKKK